MHIRELTIKNYTAFIPRLEKLPYTHRYWQEFYEKFIAPTSVSTQEKENSSELIIAKMKLLLERIKKMTDKEFDEGDCSKRFCLLFHNPNKTIHLEEFLGDFRMTKSLVEDNVDGRIDTSIEFLEDGQWVDKGLLEGFN